MMGNNREQAQGTPSCPFISTTTLLPKLQTMYIFATREPMTQLKLDMLYDGHSASNPVAKIKGTITNSCGAITRQMKHQELQHIVQKCKGTN